MSYCSKCGAPPVRRTVLHPLRRSRFAAGLYACVPKGKKRGLSIAGMVIGICTNVLLFTTCCTYSPLLTVLFFLCAVTGLIISIFGKVNEPAGRGFAISGIILRALRRHVFPFVIEALLIADMLDRFGIAPRRQAAHDIFIS